MALDTARFLTVSQDHCVKGRIFFFFYSSVLSIQSMNINSKMSAIIGQSSRLSPMEEHSYG